MPDHIKNVSKSFLTDTHDYYCIVETSSNEIETYHIDLDHANPILNGPLIKYSRAQVNDQLITGFHVRGSSHKEKINLNKSLIMYVMHGTDLYGWS